MKYANYYQPDRIQNASFAMIDKHHTYNPTFTNRLLRSEFLKHGIELNNPDVNQGRAVAFSILHDGQEIDHIPSPKYLIATENPYICPLNRNETYLSTFDGVFTWNKDLLHLPNASHLFIPNQIQTKQTPSFKDRPIFACLINANKAFPKLIDDDLYKERINVIRWYEKNAPQYFSLYGLGLSRHLPPPKNWRGASSVLDPKFLDINLFQVILVKLKIKLACIKKQSLLIAMRMWQIYQTTLAKKYLIAF